MDLKLLGITSSLLLAYNEGPQEEDTSHGDTGSRAAPSFDKECDRPAKIVSNADKNATEERHPHTVEYVYSSDEEPYIYLRKEPKADKNCYKNSTASEIQNQPKATEVKQEQGLGKPCAMRVWRIKLRNGPLKKYLPGL